MTPTQAFGLVAPDPTLEADLRARLVVVESQLAIAVQSNDAFVAEVARHLVDAGGKRFRPLLVVLASQFGDPDAVGVVPSAVVVELTHIATLYHDDVMDEATMRRGAPSANARWDNTIAILAGDFLFARASDILADLGPDAVRIQARTFERLVTGQILETVGAGDEDRLDHYLRVVSDKTASLIATSARFGAMTSGASPEIADVLARYGELIGVAFQLSDDILDVASGSDESGKTPGTDLREGVATLPVLYALAGDEADADSIRLRELLAGDLSDDEPHAEALKLLQEHPAVDRARAEVARWADEARATLQDLPEVPARDALEALCDLVVTRTG